MPVTLAEARLCANHMLSRLSDEHYEPLCAKLERVETRLRQVLHERNHPISYVYFPCNATLSNMVYFGDGSAVEVGTVGNEGFNTVELLARASAATETSVCQIEGHSLRMTAQDYLQAVDGKTPLRHVSECYMQGYLAHVSQTAACNRKHSLEARLARWLLATHDRVQGREFVLTQEFLADMLGVHRPSVSILAAVFQKDVEQPPFQSDIVLRVTPRHRPSAMPMSWSGNGKYRGRNQRPAPQAMDAPREATRC